MTKNNYNCNERENQNNRESLIPNETYKVTTDSVSFHITKTQSMRHTPRTYGQTLRRYFKYFFAYILKLGFRTIFINLLIIGICCYIFWEPGKDTILIEPFEVPEDLAKEGYTGKVIANKLADQMNYIKDNSQIFSTSGFFYEDIEKMINRIYPPVMPISSQTEQIDIQIPDAGISLNSIIQYVKKLRHHEPMRVIGEVTRHNENKLEVTVSVKGKQAKSAAGRIGNLNHQLLLAAERICKYTRPIILAGYLIKNENKNDQCIKVIKGISFLRMNTVINTIMHTPWGVYLTKAEKL